MTYPLPDPGVQFLSQGCLSAGVTLGLLVHGTGIEGLALSLPPACFSEELGLVV